MVPDVYLHRRMLKPGAQVWAPVALVGPLGLSQIVLLGFQQVCAVSAHCLLVWVSVPCSQSADPVKSALCPISLPQAGLLGDKPEFVALLMHKPKGNGWLGGQPSFHTHSSGTDPDRLGSKLGLTGPWSLQQGTLSSVNQGSEDSTFWG